MRDEDKSREQILHELSELRRQLAEARACVARGSESAPSGMSRSMLQATLESTTDGILVVDRQGAQLAVNDRFKELWGFPAEAEVSLDRAPTLDFVLGQLREPDEFLEKVRTVYSEPESESFDVLEFEDGRCFERASRPLWVDGQSAGRIWSFRDATKRRRIERQLRQSEQRLNLVINSLPAFISYVDADQCYRLVNEHYEQAFDLRCEDILGKTIHELMGEETYQRIWPHISKVLDGDPQQYEVTVEFKDLGLRRLHVDYVPHLDEGEVRGYFALATDITEKHEAESSLRSHGDRLEAMVRHRTAELEAARERRNTPIKRSGTSSLA